MMDAAAPVLHRTPGTDGASPGDLPREPSRRPDDTVPKSDSADDPGVGGALNLTDLTGLLSLLGSPEASAPSSGDGDTDKPPSGDRHTGVSHDDSAVRLLRALAPYLQDTRVLSVDRVIRLLETARGIRGILHTFGPLLGDLKGGKS